MVIDESGNVGIGQASDGDKLHVLGQGFFEDARANGVGVQINGGSSSEFPHIGVSASNPLTFQTADTERMRIDGSGNITAPNQPSFMCYPNAYTHSAGATQKTFENEAFDKGGNYNTSNGRFTAPVAGRYMFLCEVAAYSSSTALTYLGIGVRKNGSGPVYFGGWNSKPSGSYGKSLSTIILELAASDYLEVYIETSATHGIYGAEGGQNTRWSGQLLS